MVRRQLASSREAAQRLIGSGGVWVNGSVADKAARQVLPGDAIVLVGEPPRFVSRGGDKLAHGLVHFGIDPNDAACLDVGSSTGGFTDCLLQTGASRVVCVDVGTNQLHERVRRDPRVTVFEQTDIRSASTAALGGPFDVVVCDVSFIGLSQVIEPILASLAPDGVAVVLVKPQFEAGKREAAKGKGVITDPNIWRRVLGEVMASVEHAGGVVFDATVSPIRGGAGNVEFLFAIGHHSGHHRDGGVPTSLHPSRLDELVDQAGAGS